ncbi:MAG: c-type cytochrome biogenesis protein CcsB [Smithellaceae bacterium]|nr:c-type cytochrome biogenesis protein CcsB [Smithellaceae bacterium]
MDKAILSVVTFIYLAAFIFYILHMINGRFWGRLGSITAGLGLLAHTAALIIRWRSSYVLGYGHAPLTNFYESLIFFSWSVVLLYLLIEWKTRNYSLGTFVLPVGFLCLAYALLSPNVNTRIEPLIPALQSNWLTCHVLSCFMAYAAFTAACGLGILYFLKRRGKDSTSSFQRVIPPFETLEELIYQSIMLGFILLTLGIITGSVWAHYAWGSYWSWDPKETWSLITWLVYAVVLHGRYVRDWQGVRMAILAMVGFACVLVTYVGVNFLPSLHSYLQV